MRSFRTTPIILSLGLGVLAGAAPAQQLTVEAGASISFSTAEVDLGCSDLVVAGTANFDNALVTQARDVSIPTGGTFNGGSASLVVTGDWSRSGTFNAGAGSVEFGDGCVTSSSTISGSSTFNSLILSSNSGKQVLFGAGATTTVSGAFDATGGGPGNLLVIRSTSPGSEAFLDLALPASVNFVDIQDNHAIGAPVTLDADSLVSGNNAGWSFAALVPGLGLLGLLVLALSLSVSGRRAFK